MIPYYSPFVKGYTITFPKKQTVIVVIIHQNPLDKAVANGYNGGENTTLGEVHV